MNEKQKQEKKMKREREKRKLRKKVKIILSIKKFSKKCGKTRREVNGAIPYTCNIAYIDLLIYINHKQWRITSIKITLAEKSL